MTKQLLLVDDSRRYTNLISDFFKEYGYLVDRAASAKQGIGMLRDKGLDHYRVVVTDITMEWQWAGLGLIYFLFRRKYAGTVVMASTGFDVSMGMFFSKLFMGAFGVHYLIPKATVLSRDFVLYRARLGSLPLKKFVEIAPS
jgi:DNA-binding NtrC family response regulator